MAKINYIHVVGTSYGVRQNRLAELKDGDELFFKEEPNNKFDPQAIAILNKDGEHLGYIGRNDPMRESVRFALGTCVVHVRAKRLGGYWKKDGSRASYGLTAESCWKIQKDEDNVREEVDSRFRDPIQKRKSSDKRWKDEVKRHHKGRLTYQQIQNIKAAC